MRKRRLFEIVTIGYLCNCVSIMGACLYAHASGFRNVYMFMLFQTDTAVFLLVTAYLTVRLFLPAFRRFLYSSYVWRLRQTSSAFSSFLSNGCFSLPAPTYGCSMSGTQVSPSFLPTVFFFFFISASKQSSSPQRLGAQENHSCQVPSICWLFISPMSLTYREGSLSTHGIAVDPVCVHWSCHTVQRSEELSCWPVSTLCCSLVISIVEPLKNARNCY